MNKRFVNLFIMMSIEYGNHNNHGVVVVKLQLVVESFYMPM